MLWFDIKTVVIFLPCTKVRTRHLFRLYHSGLIINLSLSFWWAQHEWMTPGKWLLSGRGVRRLVIFWASRGLSTFTFSIPVPWFFLFLRSLHAKSIPFSPVVLLNCQTVLELCDPGDLSACNTHLLTGPVFVRSYVSLMAICLTSRRQFSIPFFTLRSYFNFFFFARKCLEIESLPWEEKK